MRTLESLDVDQEEIHIISIEVLRSNVEIFLPFSIKQPPGNMHFDDTAEPKLSCTNKYNNF